jgi:hypothetical protein
MKRRIRQKGEAMAKSMSTALTARLALLALPARSLLATVTSIAIPAAMVFRPRRPSDRTAWLTIAALVAVGLGCGSQEVPEPAATRLTDSEPAPDRPLSPPAASRIRDRASDATTRSAEDARSDPMDPPSDAYIAERVTEPDDFDSEAHAAEQAELLLELDSPDPEVRIDAADWIDLEGEALERMISLLKSDPDAEVRATIVDRLGEEASPFALTALVGALQDPDPEVVLQAIDALEFEADDWLIPELKPLLGHFDPEVREAAEDAIEFLE